LIGTHTNSRLTRLAYARTQTTVVLPGGPSAPAKTTEQPALPAKGEAVDTKAETEAGVTMQTKKGE
jgi:hypothetical protein